MFIAGILCFAFKFLNLGKMHVLREHVQPMYICCSCFENSYYITWFWTLSIIWLKNALYIMYLSVNVIAWKYYRTSYCIITEKVPLCNYSWRSISSSIFQQTGYQINKILSWFWGTKLCNVEMGVIHW